MNNSIFPNLPSLGLSLPEDALTLPARNSGLGILGGKLALNFRELDKSGALDSASAIQLGGIPTTYPPSLAGLASEQNTVPPSNLTTNIGQSQVGNATSTLNFLPPVINPFGLTKVGPYCAPVFADLDGDSDLDAWVPSIIQSEVKYFKNVGDSTNPSFAAPVRDPFNSSAGGYNWSSHLAFADMDGDGDLDRWVVYGGYGDGIRYDKNIGTATSPTFASSVYNADAFGLDITGGDPNKYVAFSVPTFVDLDGDGDLDACVGDTDGNTSYFQNTGTATSPSFAPAQTNPFGLRDVGEQSAPTFADVDEDGDLDAWVGNDGGHIVYFRNIGSPTSPSFVPRGFDRFGLSDVGKLSAPTFADVDGDGDLDAWVGNSAGNISYFQNSGQLPALTTDVDSLTGQAHVADTFTLEDTTQVFDDGTNAVLLNFDPVQDKIQLHGFPSQYGLGATPVSGFHGQDDFLNPANSQPLPVNDDLSNQWLI